MAAHWAYIALHLQRHTLNAVRKERCDTVHGNIASVGLPNYENASLKRQMQPSEAFAGAYRWSDVWRFNSRPGQDVSHGNAEIAYIVEGRDYSEVWTSADMTALSSTLTDVVLPRKPMYVDGRGTQWLDSRRVRKAGPVFTSRTKGSGNYSVQGQGQYMAAMAENARRLGAG